MTSVRAHWDAVWAGRDPTTVSWFQEQPARSLELIAAAGVDRDDAVIDVGCGTSPLVVRLAELGYGKLAVLDIAQTALDRLDAALVGRLGAHDVRLVCADVLAWQPDGPFALWHDRAVNHFLRQASDRRRYVDVATAAVRPGGHVVLAAFAPDGPERCSGLHVHRADPAALAAEFSPAFDLVSVTREHHSTPWHATQSFHYLLLRRR